MNEEKCDCGGRVDRYVLGPRAGKAICSQCGNTKEFKILEPCYACGSERKGLSVHQECSWCGAV